MYIHINICIDIHIQIHIHMYSDMYIHIHIHSLEKSPHIHTFIFQSLIITYLNHVIIKWIASGPDSQKLEAGTGPGKLEAIVGNRTFTFNRTFT